MIKNKFPAVVFLLLFLHVPPIFAAEYPLDLKQDFINFIKLNGGIQQARQAAFEKTRTLRKQCFRCHGEKGISPDYTRDDISSLSSINLVQQHFNTPNLAAQQALYLVQQLTMFINKERNSSVMHKKSRDLSQSEIFNLALYFSGQEAKKSTPVTKYNEEKIAKGKLLYLDRCQFCHGKEAAGQGIYARLAGLNYFYLMENIKQFRDKKSNRKHSGMTAITKDLSDEEIMQIAQFLSTHN
ncbi:MAG: c-type cytochrome [Gammaproteobacteria bacterium]|nr:c-type cytochrome [Gammaproteobacteria bacterium]